MIDSRNKEGATGDNSFSLQQREELVVLWPSDHISEILAKKLQIEILTLYHMKHSFPVSIRLSPNSNAQRHMPPITRIIDM